MAGALVEIGLIELPSLTALVVRIFSGMPQAESGFLPCFSTILFSLFTCLTALCLLGVTAFGALGIPLFLFCRALVIGMEAVSLLATQGSQGMLLSALCYLPTAAGSSLLFTLFGTRALLFSCSFAKAGFLNSQENPDFHFYFRDFLTFICFIVILSFAGGLLTMLYYWAFI